MKPYEKFYRKRVAFVRSMKQSPCMDCGGTYPPECMDFDHRPGETKDFGIGSGASHSFESLLVEIEKCDLVCANCHRIRTAARRKE